MARKTSRVATFSASANSSLSRDEGIFHLQAWHASGMSMSQYCANSKVCFAALRGWAAAAGKKLVFVPPRDSAVKSPQAPFVRVRVAEHTKHTVHKPLDTMVEVVAGDGLLIRLRDGSADTLLAVVRALREASC
jgi:hypothetical protein